MNLVIRVDVDFCEGHTAEKRSRSESNIPRIFARIHGRQNHIFNLLLNHHHSTKAALLVLHRTRFHTSSTLASGKV